MDKLIRKTNLALVVGTHSWRDQFMEAITVSAGKRVTRWAQAAPGKQEHSHVNNSPVSGRALWPVFPALTLDVCLFTESLWKRTMG